MISDGLWHHLWPHDGSGRALVQEKARFGTGYCCCRIQRWRNGLPYCCQKPHSGRRVRTSRGTFEYNVDRTRCRFKWTMRILGFVQLACLAVSNLTVARRFPPSDGPYKTMDLRIFQNVPYTVYTLAGLVSFLGLYTVCSSAVVCLLVWLTSLLGFDIYRH